MGNKVKVQELDSHYRRELLDVFTGYPGFARFGEAGYLISATYKEEADAVKNMIVRSDDVWVSTFPRSGTTLTQELVWLLKNDLDYEMASKSILSKRYTFLGLRQTGNPDIVKAITAKPYLNVGFVEALKTAPSPRYIKNHRPLSLLPGNLLDTAKVVYVARDPRDVAVSGYNFYTLMKNYVGDFKTYWSLFIKDLVPYAPYFRHVKEAWALRHHPNMLFIFYEDLIKDLPSSIKLIANFLGKEVTEEKIAKLCEHLDINNFRKNESVNLNWLTRVVGKPDSESFIRKGKPGGWREWFDAEMAAQAQMWMRAQLAGSDLRFPDTA